MGDILVLACLCVCLCGCMGHGDIVLKLHVWIPHKKKNRRIFLVFPELSPLVKLRPFDKQGDEILSYCPFLNFVLCNFANVISRKVL